MDETTITLDGGTTTVHLIPLSTSILFSDTMTDQLEITAGDTHEPVRARLFDPTDDDEADKPADLEDARITFRMTDRSGEVVVDSRASVADRDEQGWVEYDWRRGETDMPGTYRIRFRVRYPDRSVMHYPNGRPARLLIRQP